MKNIREFWESTRRGAPMSRTALWGALEVLSILSLLATIVTAPFYTSLIDNAWYQGVAWFFVLCLILIFAYAVGLMPYRGMREMKHDLDKTLQARDARITELVPLEEYKKQQIGHEEQWLHPVLEYVDIDKRPGISEDQVVVNFSFDSGLVYAFQPHRMWVSPTFGGSRVQEPQLELALTPNFLAGKRSQLSTMKITIKDKQLLEFLGTARTGHSWKKGLEVKMQFRPGESIHVFTVESY